MIAWSKILSTSCPGVHLGGSVQVDEGAFLGIGSSAIPGRKVGAWTTVGAGTVVVRDLSEGVVAYGVPAKAARPVGFRPSGYRGTFQIMNF